MRVLVVEDEMLAAEKLIGLIREYDSQISVEAITDSVVATVAWLSENPRPDLIFLDVQLSDGLCFSIFEKIPITAPVIFTTAFDIYAIRAFKLNSIDYLLKPVTRKNLAESLNKFREMKRIFNNGNNSSYIELLQSIKEIRKYKSRFIVKSGGAIISMPVEEVAYFFANAGFNFLVTHAGQQYLIDYSLEELEGFLDPSDFFRINRKYMVAFRSVKVVHPHFKGKLKLTLVPTVEDEIMISSEKSSTFKQWLEK